MVLSEIRELLIALQCKIECNCENERVLIAQLCLVIPMFRLRLESLLDLEPHQNLNDLEKNFLENSNLKLFVIEQNKRRIFYLISIGEMSMAP